MDYTVHEILQGRLLAWVAFPFFRGSSQPRDWAQVSIAGGLFINWTTPFLILLKCFMSSREPAVLLIAYFSFCVSTLVSTLFLKVQFIVHCPRILIFKGWTSSKRNARGNCHTSFLFSSELVYYPDQRLAYEKVNPQELPCVHSYLIEWLSA